MTISTLQSAQLDQTSTLNSKADELIARTRRTTSSASSSTPASAQDAKIQKAGKDFESILLGSWLQQAEQSFAKVPGGDGQDDDDSGKDQFQGIAMQALAGSLTASGGIGIAKMISQHLHGSAHPGAHGPSDAAAPPDAAAAKPS